MRDAFIAIYISRCVEDLIVIIIHFQRSCYIKEDVIQDCSLLH